MGLEANCQHKLPCATKTMPYGACMLHCQVDVQTMSSNAIPLVCIVQTLLESALGHTHSPQSAAGGAGQAGSAQGGAPEEQAWFVQQALQKQQAPNTAVGQRSHIPASLIAKEHDKLARKEMMKKVGVGKPGMCTAFAICSSIAAELSLHAGSIPQTFLPCLQGAGL